MIEPGRIDVLGSQISAVSSEEAIRLIVQRLEEGQGGYVCFTNVHTTVTGCRNADFRAITNGSFLSVADGKPIYWMARAQRPIGHIPGPDFMMSSLVSCLNRRHFLYGSTPAVLDRLARKLREAIPGVEICGALSPPFRPLTTDEKRQHYAAIRDAKAELVWVGLGAPKQEQWMADAFEALRPAILLGVGAAFDFHSGLVRRAPRALRAAGLEWLFRLLRQPRRLWRRYLVTNTFFIAYLAREILSGKLRVTRRGSGSGEPAPPHVD